MFLFKKVELNVLAKKIKNSEIKHFPEPKIMVYLKFISIYVIFIETYTFDRLSIWDSKLLKLFKKCDKYTIFCLFIY